MSGTLKGHSMLLSAVCLYLFLYILCCTSLWLRFSVLQAKDEVPVLVALRKVQQFLMNYENNRL